MDSSESSQSGVEVNDTEEDDLFVTPFAGAMPDTTDDPHDDEEVPDDGFIVEDDDGPAELPMEYSMNTHQELAHHFKIICQLFVHIAVRPPGERHAFMKNTMKSKLDSLSMSCLASKCAVLRGRILFSPTPNRPSETFGPSGFACGVLRLAFRFQEQATAVS